MHFSHLPMRAKCAAQLRFLDLIAILVEEYKLLSFLLRNFLLPVSYVQIFSSALHSQAGTTCVLCSTLKSVKCL